MNTYEILNEMNDYLKETQPPPKCSSEKNVIPIV